MLETYEDDLPAVVQMNRDYDEGYFDAQYNPLPDCTNPLPLSVTPLYNAAYDDELVPASVSMSGGSDALWTLIFPVQLRVWRYDTTLYSYVQVVSGVEYSAASTGSSFSLLIEGLSPTATTENYLTISTHLSSVSDTPISDRVKFEVVSIDLEIAEISELDEETVAASILVNDDYDEGNTASLHTMKGIEIVGTEQVLVTDNDKLSPYMDSMPKKPGIVTWDDDLTEASLTIDGPNDQTGKYWIEVVGEPKYAQYVLVWLADGSAQVPRTRETAKSITLDANAVDLLIEGLAAYTDEQHPIQLIAHFEPDGDYANAGVEADVTDEALALVGVNCWTRDTWTGERGEYTGTATAHSSYDTLEQLAKNITGKAEDAIYLWAANPGIEPIAPNDVVDISCLLEILEERLRDNVVAAALADKAAEFGSGLDFGPVGNSTEATINGIFGVGRSASKLPIIECHHMIGVIMARGVIMELFPGEFDAMDLSFGHFMIFVPDTPGQYFNRYDPAIDREDLDEGDWACFYNKRPEYEQHHPDGMWGAENVIKVGDDSYYGWGKANPLSYLKWKKELCDAYNAGLEEDDTIDITDIPGYNDLEPVTGDAGFIDVAELAEKIFDFRT